MVEEEAIVEVSGVGVALLVEMTALNVILVVAGLVIDVELVEALTLEDEPLLLPEELVLETCVDV